MNVAVWDTYVKKQDGSVLHFDIVVPESLKDADVVFGYGKQYLASKNEAEGRLEGEECQFCHIESPDAEIIDAIREQGFYIIEMEDIPASLPKEPSRRDYILHLRAHYAGYRFADFREKTMEDIRAMAASVKS